jgi:hypothetical protein
MDVTLGRHGARFLSILSIQSSRRKALQEESYAFGLPVNTLTSNPRERQSEAISSKMSP